MMSGSILLRQSREFCFRVAKRSGSSFVPCFRLLPREKREAMAVLYAFLRHTDDIGDSDAPVEQRREELDAWEESLRQSLENRHEASLREESAELLLPALVDALRRFGVPPETLYAVVEGVRMDLEPREYRTFDELAEYCRRVASAVGIACIHIWGVRNLPEATRAADRCGIAFQLTNILRDLREDADRGRVYLPSEDLAACGSSAERLREGPRHPAFPDVVRFEADRARGFYAEGIALADYLDRDGRRVFGMMTELYYRLLLEIERNGEMLFSRRLRLGTWTRTRIALRWVLFPSWPIRLT